MQEDTEFVNGFPVPDHLEAPELVKIIDSGADERFAALRALGNKKERSAFEILVAKTKDADPALRRGAVEALGHHELGEEAAGEFLRLLGDDSPEVVREACHMLASFHVRDAHEPLRRLARNPDAETREAAVRSFHALWMAEDFGWILETFRQDPSQEVKKAAAWLLFNKATRENWRALFSEWNDDPAPRRRAWACNLLEQFDEATVIEAQAVRRLLADPEPGVRKAAASAMRRMFPGQF